MKWALIYLFSSIGDGTALWDTGFRYDTFAICKHEAAEFVKQVPEDYRYRLKKKLQMFTIDADEVTKL